MSVENSIVLNYEPVPTARLMNPWVIKAFLMSAVSGPLSMIMFCYLLIAGFFLWNPLLHPLSLAFTLLPEILALNMAVIGIGGILLHRRSQHGIWLAVVAMAQSLVWPIVGILLGGGLDGWFFGPRWP